MLPECPCERKGVFIRCYDKCADDWPLFLTQGAPAPAAKEQANADLLGTIERKNGATQVSYNGWPLYYYGKDDEPGDTQGQQAQSHGGVWYLVSPDGTVVAAEQE